MYYSPPPPSSTNQTDISTFMVAPLGKLYCANTDLIKVPEVSCLCKDTVHMTLKNRSSCQQLQAHDVIIWQPSLLLPDTLLWGGTNRRALTHTHNHLWVMAKWKSPCRHCFMFPLKHSGCCSITSVANAFPAPSNCWDSVTDLMQTFPAQTRSYRLCCPTPWMNS